MATPPALLTSLVAQVVKASAYNVGDLDSMPGSGRSPGEGNGNPSSTLDVSGGSGGKSVCLQCGRPGFDARVRRSPGEGNGNPSGTLAWRIPWREEPGGLQSTGSQRVEHDLVSKQQTTMSQDKWTTLFLEMERSEQFLRVSSLI